MDFKQLETFISVAKLKSFSKAADTIFLSQPAISSQISSLEKELNVQLFDRNSKEVFLTPAGETFLGYAIDIINSLNKAQYHMSSFNDQIAGTLNIAGSSTPCNSIVPGLIKKYSSIYPEVYFNILEQSSSEIIENILKFNCELGITGKKIKDNKIESYKLIDDELVLISEPSMNIPESIDVSGLANYKFILREKGSATRKTLEEALQSSGTDSLNVCCEVNNLDTLFQFVKAGMGVSVVSKLVCSDYVASGSIKLSSISNINLKRDIYLLVSSKRTLTPSAKAFFDLCKKEFGF